MPNNITYFPTATGLHTETGNAFYVSLGYGKILKMTSLTTYTMLDVSGELPGIYYINPHYLLYYDGTRLVRILQAGGGLSTTAAGYSQNPYTTENALSWYSTNEGVSWVRAWSYHPLVINNFANTVSTGNTGHTNYTLAYYANTLSKITTNGNIILTFTGTMSANGSPDYYTYISDITGNLTQSVPDYVGQPVGSVVNPSYIRTA
jgi:hypothetical protein